MTVDDLLGRRFIGGVERMWFFARDARVPDPRAWVTRPPILTTADGRGADPGDARTDALVVRIDGAVYVLWPDLDRGGAVAVARMGDDACPFSINRRAGVLARGPTILPPIECDVVRGDRGGIRATRVEDGVEILEVDAGDPRGLATRWDPRPGVA